MTQTEMISKLADYANTIRGIVENKEVVASITDAKIGKHLEALARQAKATAEKATSPVRIGVVGQFSTGKTLLLGAIAGYADTLPISEIPTTGNVTAIRFRQNPKHETSCFTSFSIEYLDEDSAKKCLGELLRETREVAATVGLSSQLNEQANKFNAADVNSLANLEAWCESVWSRSSDPDLRALIQELIWFWRSFMRCRVVCHSPEYKVGENIVKDGLALPVPRELQSLTFAQLGSAPPELTEVPESLTPEIVQSTFPLIRLLRIEVHVSKKIWDLTGLTGSNEFELLDFPGLGSAFSGIRDRYLSLTELRNVQTILVVLGGDRAGGKGWAGLLESMRKTHPDLANSVLVGVGRFDQLPLRTDGIAKLRRLVEEASSGSDDFFTPTTLSAANLCTELPVLQTTIAVAKQLVPKDRNDRIAFLSPLISLAHQHEKEPSLQVGSPEFVEKMLGDMESAREVRQLWEQTAELLKANDQDPDSKTLAEWLSAFARDGGIGRLRKMIGSHVQNHGIKNLFEAVQQSADQLAQQVKKLGEDLPAANSVTESRTDPDRLESVRKRFTDLSAKYAGLKDSIETELNLLVDQNGKKLPLAQVISNHAIAEVGEWPLWTNLFQATRDGFVVEPEMDDLLGISESDNDGEDDLDQEELLPESTTQDYPILFPVYTDDLYGSFEICLKRLEAYTKNLITVGLENWLEELSSELVAARHELLPLLNEPSLPRAIRRLRTGLLDPKATIQAVQIAFDPLRIKSAIDRRYQAKLKAANLTTDPQRLFPCAKGTSSSPGRVLGWANQLFKHKNPDYHPEKNLSHVCQVMRLMDDMASVVSEEMVQLLSRYLKELKAVLAQFFLDLDNHLSSVTGNEMILQAIVNAKQSAGGDQSSGDVYGELRQLVQLKWPLDSSGTTGVRSSPSQS